MDFLSTSHSRIKLGMIVLAVLFAFSSTEAFAQRFAFVADGANRKKSMYDNYMAQLDSQRATAKHRMEARLADINLACELEKIQQQKLEVAAKGAVNAFMKDATKKLKQSAKQYRFDFEPNVPPEAEEVDGDDGKAVGGIANNRQVVVMNNIAQGQIEFEVERQKIWMSTLKKTLTPEQSDELRDWLAKREAFIQEAAVNHFIASADLILLLTPDQRKKLTTWVDENYGKQLAIRMNKGPAQPQNIFFLGNGNGPLAQLEKLESEVAVILDESQRVLWAKKFQKELDQLENVVMKLRRQAPVINLIEVDDN